MEDQEQWEYDQDFYRTFYNCTTQLLIKLNANYSYRINDSMVVELVEKMLNSSDGGVDAGLRRDVQQVVSICSQPLPHDLPWWQKLIWAALFATMLTVATGGNIIVMWIVLAHRRMRTVTNYFLVNLSISDLLMSLLNCICNFIFMINSHWPFGSVYCTLNNFVSSTTVAANVFTLMAISLDRYMAIVHPLHHRKSRSKARCALVAIWLSSGLLAIPYLLYSNIMTQSYYDGQTRVICYVHWPDGSMYPNSVTDYVYNLVFLAVTYLLPMVVMAVCYTLMGKELWGSRSIGELTQRQLDSMNSKKKVVRMFILVVSIFAICWLPYHVYFIYAYHNNEITRSTYVREMYLTFYWLAMSNAMVNPVIYYWMNKRQNQERVSLLEKKDPGDVPEQSSQSEEDEEWNRLMTSSDTQPGGHLIVAGHGAVGKIPHATASAVNTAAPAVTHPSFYRQNHAKPTSLSS